MTRTATRSDAYTRGVTLVLIAGVLWSGAGLLIRLMDGATGWQILFYRSVTMVPVLLIAIAIRSGGPVVPAFRRAGWTALIGGASLAASMISFVFAILHTTVANVLFVLSAAPLAAGLASRVILGERVRPGALLAAAGVVVGVGVMTLDAAAGGRLFGSLITLVMAAGFAGFAVALRWGRQVDMLPSVCMAGIITLVVGGLLAGGLAVTGRDLLLSGLLGAIQMGLGLIVFTLGSVHVPAMELTLLSMTEVALGPIWVWWGVGEVPSGLTVVGGVTVLAAVLLAAISGARSSRVPIGAA